MPLSRREAIALSLATGGLRAAAPLRFSRKIKVGLIGVAGHPAEITKPLPQLPDVELAAISEIDPVLRKQWAKRYPAARIYEDHRTMLGKEKLDVIGVCNPNGDRAAGILDAFAAGAHVIAEKPVAIDFDSYRKVKRAILGSKKAFSILLPMRCDQPYMALRDIVKRGLIGEVAQIAGQKSYTLGERPEWQKVRASYGGTIPWIGIHMIDLMRWTSGREFTEVASFKSRIGFAEYRDMENVTASSFRLDNGGVAELRLDYLRPELAGSHGDDRLRLAGTEGVAEYQAATGVTLMTKSLKPHKVESMRPEKSLFTEFLDAVYNGKAQPVPLEDIFRVNEAVLFAELAAVEHRIVKIEDVKA